MISANDIKWLKSLHVKKSRNEAGLYLAEGSRSVLDLIHHNPELIHRIYATDGWIIQNEAKILQYKNFIIQLSESQLQAVASLKTTKEVLAVVKMNKSIPSKELLSSLNSLLYLYDIQDPGNFGTLLRTADWFGHKVILCSSNCVDPYNNKSVQASMSSLSRIMIFTIEADEIRKKFPNFRIIATCMNGQDCGSVNFTEKSIFCLGNEAHGLPAEFISASDIAITIKGNSLGAESLNVSIAGGIILSHLNSQS